MPANFKEDALIGQPAIVLFYIDLLPRLISSEVDVSAVEIEMGEIKQ